MLPLVLLLIVKELLLFSAVSVNALAVSRRYVIKESGRKTCAAVVIGALLLLLLFLLLLWDGPRGSRSGRNLYPGAPDRFYANAGVWGETFTY